MKSWKIFLTEKEENTPENPVEDQGYTLFFKKNKKYYGVKEQDRIIFAKIKTKDTKDLSADKNEIKFLAKELNTGKIVSFKSKDIKDIEICEKEEVEKNVSIS